MRGAQGFVCKVCRAGGRKAADKFRFEDVELECVYKFAYLGDMLNDTSGVEQVVAARVRAAWMKFRELGEILCARGASLRMKDVVYKACVCSVLMYGAETWAMKVGGVSEDINHREQLGESNLQNKVVMACCV